jgi:hypothetical protein
MIILSDFFIEAHENRSIQLVTNGHYGVAINF